MSKDSRQRVLLTGATGNWGRETLRELQRRDTVDVVAFALPTDSDRAVLEEFAEWDALTVLWGDLTNYDDVARAIEGADTILHVGAVVSPIADQHPGLARRVNIGSMQNIIRAVKALPNPGAVGVVGIGSVAQTGDRQEPHHWGRVGDPIRVSQFDEYGHTKVIAEKLLVDSGLPKWAWLRQTGILHAQLTEVSDPIMTHVPLAGVLEWVSDADSARLLAGIAEGPPESFWKEIYNVGGGEGWRITNYQLQVALAEGMGVADSRTWYDRNWFALKNFHGHWYTDSDDLEARVPFRQDTFDAAMARVIAGAPGRAGAAGKVPGWIVKHVRMKPLARSERGTMHAIRTRNTEAIDAYFGSLQAWEAIGDWSTFRAPAPSLDPGYLDHGYDESMPPAAWTAADYIEAARFRGGELLSKDAGVGEVERVLAWRCALGHIFAGSPRLILRAGHWCPKCVRDSAAYSTQAETNPFLAQLETGDLEAAVRV